MTTLNRQELRAKIDKLKIELQHLSVEEYKLNDDTQWYSEETIRYGRNMREHIFGMIHWMEDFKDSDAGEVIPIERCSIIMKDGVFIAQQ